MYYCEYDFLSFEGDLVDFFISLVDIWYLISLIESN